MQFLIGRSDAEALYQDLLKRQYKGVPCEHCGGALTTGVLIDGGSDVYCKQCGSGAIEVPGREYWTPLGKQQEPSSYVVTGPMFINFVKAA